MVVPSAYRVVIVNVVFRFIVYKSSYTRMVPFSAASFAHIRCTTKVHSAAFARFSVFIGLLLPRAAQTAIDGPSFFPGETGSSGLWDMLRNDMYYPCK